MRRFLAIAFLLIVSNNLLAGLITIPKYSKTIISTNSHVSKKLVAGKLLRFTIWNVEKGKNVVWPSDFVRLANRVSDFVLVQEAVDSSAVMTPYHYLHRFKFVTAVNYIYRGVGTGVSIGSRYYGEKFSFKRTKDRESFINTPKISLLGKYPIAGTDQSLLVISVHAINFTTLAPFRRQLSSIARAVARHQGPVFVGGDFNTWKKSRKRLLDRIFNKVGLKHVAISNDPRGARGSIAKRMKLDHAYVRNMQIVKAIVLSSINSSDHYPIWISAKLDI